MRHIVRRVRPKKEQRLYRKLGYAEYVDDGAGICGYEERLGDEKAMIFREVFLHDAEEFQTA